MLDQHWRTGVEKGLRPIGSHLRRAGFTADQITLLGLAASLFTGIAVATGHFGWGAFGLALSGLTDVLDGAVAKSATETSGPTASKRGAFFDSVADRVSDGFVLGGAAWYLAGTGDPHTSVLAFGVAGLSMLVSYERAKAEALGYDARGGLMERAERMFVLGLALIFDLLVPALWLLVVANTFTVTQRFAKVWSQATPAAQKPETPKPETQEPETQKPETIAGDSETRPGWWVTSKPASSSESRMARWRTAARPPGERGVADGRRKARWLVSTRPPGTERSGSGPSGIRRATRDSGVSGDSVGDESRLGRWWADSQTADGMRSQWRRLRGRTRP